MTGFAEVLAHDDVRETFVARGRVGVMAYHGGALEVLTDVIASTVAERTDASYYGVVQPDGMRDHFPSITVTREDSSALAEFLDTIETVVTIHGFGRPTMMSSVLLGGGNRSFADHIGATLRSYLPAYDIVTELDDIPTPLRGMHARNPVNIPTLGGVQIELPPRVRGLSPLWWDWEGEGLTPHTCALIDGLVEAIDTWTPHPTMPTRERDGRATPER